MTTGIVIDRTEAERLFLSAVLHDNGVLAEACLTDEMFTSYRGICTRIMDLASRGAATESALIAASHGLDPVLVAKLEPWTTANWQMYQQCIFEAWATDKLQVALKLASGLPYQEAIEAVERSMTAVVSRQTSVRTKRLGELLPAALERITARVKAKGQIPGMSWGMESIDRATLGAQAGQLIVIAARPSQGKSALMAQVSRSQASAHKVGIVSVESSESELTQRLLAQESRVDGRKLQSGFLSQIEMAKLAEATRRLEGLRDNLVIHAQPGIRFQQLASVARRMVREGVKILYVDYLQIVRMPGKDKRSEEVSDVSTSLKALAMELGIPIVALAQLSRDSDERRPTMGDCQHSSQIEQDADQVWLIWHQKDREGKVQNSRIILDKVRDGQTLDVFVTFDRPILSFFEVIREARKEEAS